MGTEHLFLLMGWFAFHFCGLCLKDEHTVEKLPPFGFGWVFHEKPCFFWLESLAFLRFSCIMPTWPIVFSLWSKQFEMHFWKVHKKLELRNTNESSIFLPKTEFVKITIGFVVGVSWKYSHFNLKSFYLERSESLSLENHYINETIHWFIQDLSGTAPKAYDEILLPKC